jgi:hypothetical protein
MLRLRLFLAFVACVSLAPEAAAADFIVDDAGDAGDALLDGICETAGASCTLRAAIEEANFLAGSDRILFAASLVIAVPAPLPAIAGQVTLDGTLTPGFVAGSPGVPIVVIENSGTAADGVALVAGADGSVLRGLWVRGFDDPGAGEVGGIALRGAGGVTVAGNYVGPVGGVGAANEAGVFVFTAGNVIGGPAPADRNVVVGNNTGIDLREPGSGNRVLGNFVGVDPDGSTPNPNAGGIFIQGSQDDVVGGSAAGAGCSPPCNVLSGNLTDGITISGTLAVAATRTVVVGNRIGTDAAGQTAVPNFTGVLIIGADENRVGGTSAGERNLISGNFADGVSIVLDARDNVVSGNTIGLDADGVDRLGNFPGVSVLGDAFLPTSGNLIGGSDPAAANVISGNQWHGVFITAHGNTVEGNLIGTDPGGGVAIPNGLEIARGDGVYLADAVDTVVRGNVISGNLDWGVEIESHEISLAFATGNLLLGNRIGVGADGTTPLGNGDGGVIVHGAGATGNRIGGTGFAEGNVIAHNGGAAGPGVAITDPPVGGDPDATGNPIRGNSIFENAGLGIDLGGTFDHDTAAYAGSGPDANDPLDADPGPNNHQNYPSISQATILGPAATRIQGTLASLAATAFEIDFFGSPSADPGGFGEGAIYLGSAPVVTDGSGSASFDVTLPTASLAAPAVTATATVAGASGDSSEFSPPFALSVPITAIPAASEVALLVLGAALAVVALRQLRH